MRTEEIKLIAVQDACEPVFGKKHNHFSEQEIRWVSQKSGIKNIEKRVYDANSFIDEYPDLKVLESNLISIETLKGKLIWYIINLILYGRINIGIEVLKNISLRNKDFNKTTSPIINFNFINEFRQTALRMGYSINTVNDNLITNLNKISMHFQQPVDEIAYRLKDLTKQLENNPKLIKSLSLRGIANVLNEMNYDCNIEEELNNIFSKHVPKLYHNRYEINKAVEEYISYLKKTHSFRTYKTEKSHLKIFFNFLNEEYPEIIKLNMLKNSFVVNFIKNQQKVKNYRGNKNTNATINHRIQALEKMLRYYREQGKYSIPDNITTKYDYLRETKKYPKYVSKKEIFRVLIAIKQALNDKKYQDDFQELCVLLILIDTGRRIHEVLALKYNCLRNNRVAFHKTKNRKTTIPIVGETTINAIRKAKEYAQIRTKPLYSKIDNMTVKRLFPSKDNKGRTLVSRYSVDKLFKFIQVENAIVDDSGKPLYTLHDNKRNLVTNMLAAKVSPEEIAKYLNQDTNSLFPYEVNNEFALSVLKDVESKALLIGESYDKEAPIKDNEILKLIGDIDVLNRHKENLIYSINNTEETLPLFLGVCMDNSHVELCGDLVCMACEEYRTDNIEEFEKYAIKLLKFIYQNKRYSKTKRIEKQLYKALGNIYLNIDNMSLEDFENKVKDLKKQARRIVKYEKGT